MDLSNTRFNWGFIATLLVAFTSLAGATSRGLQDAQIGTEICFCAPNSYEFTLDFSLTCPPVNITLGDAVAATTCMVSPFTTAEVADLVPVSVQSIEVLELNQNLQVWSQELIEPKDEFLDGDTFSYTSYAAIPGDIVKPEDLPRAIQLNINGKNTLGELIINVYLITFTNSCGAYPVLFEGQWAGWTRFSDLGPPSPELCPVVPTPSPTMPPTPSPVPIVMSMSMSMDLGGMQDFSIEDLLEDELDYREYGKSKGNGKGKGKGKGDGKGKREKSKSGGKGGKDGHWGSDKLSKPNSKDGKSKDGAKSGKSKEGSKSGKSKDGSKSGNKSGKSKGGHKESEKLSKGGKGSKDGKPWTNGKDGKSKDGKSKDGSKGGKSKDGSKDSKGGKYGYDYKETDKLSKGSKDGKPYTNAKDGKSKDGSKDGAKSGKSKDGAKGGKSSSLKTANKLTKPGSKDVKSKDGSKDGSKGKIYESFPHTKDGKSKGGSKAGGKSSKYEGNGQKENTESKKESNKLNKFETSKGKGGSVRFRI